MIVKLFGEPVEIVPGMLVKYRDVYDSDREKWLYVTDNKLHGTRVYGFRVVGADNRQHVIIKGDACVDVDWVETIYGQRWSTESVDCLNFDQLCGLLCGWPDLFGINTYSGVYCVWRRSQHSGVREMTVDEVSKELGYEVKIVGKVEK